ncbi:hypothetical protein D3C71_1865810 [compost metagenome]
MLAGDERQRLLQIGPQFVRRIRPAGIAARDGDAAAQLLVLEQEAAHIIALPAVQRNFNLRELS